MCARFKFIQLLIFCAVSAITLSQSAQAASFLKKNFYLPGPGYDSTVGECYQALPRIAYQFADKESTFWNSSLQITGFADVREIAFRPWNSGAAQAIPRRFCSAQAMLNDGVAREVHYSLIEDGGFAGIGSGVEFCIVGLDRNWAYNPSCKAAKP